MKKLIFSVAVVSAFALSSCGGGEMTLCDCMGLRDKYESKADAEKELGKEKIDKCMDLMKEAKEEDVKKCEKK
jgi:hypothetical protein